MSKFVKGILIPLIIAFIFFIPEAFFPIFANPFANFFFYIAFNWVVGYIAYPISYGFVWLTVRHTYDSTLMSIVHWIFRILLIAGCCTLLIVFTR